MEINKQELGIQFSAENWDYVFKTVAEITDFLLVQKFKIFDLDLRDDFIQECNIAFLKKIHKGKIDPENNIYSYIWQSSYWRIQEILRKESNRNRIAQINYLEEEEKLDYLNYNYLIAYDSEIIDAMGVMG